MKRILLVTAMSCAALPAFAEDFGATVDAMLTEKSASLFGIAKPLTDSAAASAEEGYRTPASSVSDTVALADGLTAAFLTRDAANHTDMLAFYPAEAPTHMIVCNEGDAEQVAEGKMQPGVQRIALADGKVETIVRGTSSCDGIRTTAWGTILFTEEEKDGGAYELYEPLTTTNVTIVDRKTGETSDPAKVVRRMALPTMAWEGIHVMDNGVVYAGDELRPGDGDLIDNDGGAIFKFLPETPAAGGAIADPAASPFAAGKVYAMQVSCYGDKVQFGQGCETGAAGWVEVKASKVRAEANFKGATGYYRPEDLHADPMYAGEGLRFCWTNTGNEGARNYSETMCAVDLAPMEVKMGEADGKKFFHTTVTRFIEGDLDLNSMDNLAFQPGTGILYAIEDHPNGDIWACLPDGADRNLKTDGCIKILSVKDTSAEPTGFTFAPDGKTAYVSIQHSDDSAMPSVDDYGTDDVLVITGFGDVAK
jgi:secreted PhoX family phosphatase